MEKKVGNDRFLLNQNEYYYFMQYDLLKLLYTHDNFTIENINADGTFHLYIVQRDIMFLGMTLDISKSTKMKTELQNRQIFDYIYEYNPNYNASDYFQTKKQNNQTNLSQ